MAEVFDRVRSRGAEPLNMHRTLAHSPEVLAAYVGLAHTLRDSANVARAYCELVILRTAHLTG
ncbi:hypothetical protein DI005_08965 [Prauserella sp. PE36]|uniref:hypothetical protein n=1 Tax=Prauserella sp. PE36 TaxID=1504709 RepID=UPI000DE5389D|nr:hypothetical protein [Prauserella sp. PE36]RBM21652.1 hypothetical protein DI005_08965 [Prauserella sp. PE36]